jgi:diadenosine tetraphosphate (Ap4A) HIT family hydrolase
MLNRKKEIEDAYQEYLKGNHIPFQDNEVVNEYKYWKVLKNKFPYDVRVHHLIIPKREFAMFRDMNNEEKKELEYIKELFNNNYDCFLQNTLKKRSIRTIYHEHFILF